MSRPPTTAQMLKFSNEHIAMLQAALAPPPPLVPPPQMLSREPVVLVVVPSTPAQQAPAQSSTTSQQQPEPTKKIRQTSKTRVPLLWAGCLLMANGTLLAVSSVLSPHEVWLCALVGSPLLAGGVSIMAISAEFLYERVLGILLAGLYPSVCFSGLQWGSFVYAALLSLFLSAVLGHGKIGRFVWCGPIGVSAASLLLVFHAPLQVAWGVIVTLLCMQVVLGVGRMYGVSLVVTVAA